MDNEANSSTLGIPAADELQTTPRMSKNDRRKQRIRNWIQDHQGDIFIVCVIGYLVTTWVLAYLVNQ